MNFELNDYHRNTPDNDLLDDIKKVARKLNKNTVTMEEYEKYGTYHQCTLIRRFGSWFAVLSKANLEPSRSPINISDEDLFKNIYDVWIKLSRQPKYAEMRKPLSAYSAGTYDKRFGSWRKALEQFLIYINVTNDPNEPVDNNEEVFKEELKEESNIPMFKHKTKRNISLRLRFAILNRDRFTCKKCGRSPSKDPNVTLHVDHIIPWSKGGETVPENLETKCEQCNLGKGNAFFV